MKTTATNKKIRELLSNLRSGKLIPRPDFQRRLVWNNKDKYNFIETVLLNLPFPEVYVAAGDVNLETGEATEMLVDGQQRITTLNQYFIGSKELKLPKTILPYEKLPDDKKEEFLQYDVVVRDLGKVAIEQIKEVFRRINATKYSLNAMEIHNARYEGEFKEFAENYAQKTFFEKHGVFSAVEIRRMQDIRYILAIVVTVLSTYFNRDDEIENYLSKYNDEFPEKAQTGKELDQILEFLETMNFPSTSRVWQKSDLFSLIVELHTSLIKKSLQLDPQKTSRKLKDFYRIVDTYGSSKRRSKSHTDDVIQYYNAALQATNDRNNRISRGNIIQKIILSSQ